MKTTEIRIYGYQLGDDPVAVTDRYSQMLSDIYVKCVSLLL